MRILLALHATLLLLASTGFTIVTAFLGNASLHWCYVKYASSNGWGVKYVSDYSAAEIVTYLLAYTLGVVGFLVALKSRHPVVGLLGVVLSLIGLLSFAIEGSHWIVDHNRSWLAFSPAVMFVLAFLACLPKRFADDGNPTAFSVRPREGRTQTG
ncbi:hypothetical protein Q31b_24660 [Novipirellula aureliae]|uniref:Uncharacterized protein n=1 Tax=Novipirellula aureliae TaxID=2527966 RepID=A0A5C6E7H6_9BACT|nr:hypothetical protein [Novipirellula aureliae]TWU43426.1 hypothetical protein Q31b_24660 [Novipirellula aureliae]